LPGANEATIFGLITPVSTRPTGTGPMPPILYTSCNGNLRGLDGGRMASDASRRVLPVYKIMILDFISIFFC